MSIPMHEGVLLLGHSYVPVLQMASPRCEGVFEIPHQLDIWLM